MHLVARVANLYKVHFIKKPFTEGGNPLMRFGNLKVHMAFFISAASTILQV